MYSPEGKKVLVLGAGKSGVEAAKLLLEKKAEKVVLSDIKPKNRLPAEALALEKEGVEIEAEGHTGDSILHSDLIIVSPGVPVSGEWYDMIQRHGKNFVGEIEFAYDLMKENGSPEVIAVTGTNGKTTTATLVYEVLKKQAGDKVMLAGNIGIPFSKIVREGKKCDYIVLEISSFQLETIKNFRPYIAVILNITHDHMDRYPSLQAYAEAKANVFRNQTKDDFLILNAEDKFTNIMSPLSASSKVLFSAYNELDDGYFVSEGAFYKNVFGKKEKLFDTGAMKLKGKHNQENVMAALIISDILKFDPGGTISAIKEFNGLPHRIEYAGEVNGIRYYNDSKATNIDASVKAVRSFSDDMAVVLGGREKNTDFNSLLEAMPGSAKYVIAMGENSDRISGIFGEKMKVIKAENMEEAVKKSAEIKDIKVVLLSPACASFDMFRDYKHRGEEFKKQVRKAAGNE